MSATDLQAIEAEAFPTTDPRYRKWADILPPLDEPSFRGLKASISEKLWTGRILLDQDLNILDGHSAWRAFLELGLRPRPCYLFRLPEDRPELGRAIVLNTNLMRRQLSREEKRKIIRDQLALCPTLSARGVAELLGVSHHTVEKIRKTGQMPSLEFKGGRGKRHGVPRVLITRPAERLEPMAATLRGIHAKRQQYTPRSLRTQEAREKRERLQERGQLIPHKPDIQHCDFRNLNVERGTADLIWSDLPWIPRDLKPDPKRFYQDLLDCADRWLAPHGLLCIYPGLNLINLANEVLGEWFTYLHTLAVLSNGAFRSRHNGFRPGWFPILIYGLKPYGRDSWLKHRADGIIDVVRATWNNRIDRQHHKYSRSVSETVDCLQRLTRMGQCVIDPCGGGFTTAVACKSLGLRFTGCDIDERNCNLGRQRVADWQPEPSKAG
jgi:hypothetical protein